MAAHALSCNQSNNNTMTGCTIIVHQSAAAFCTTKTMDTPQCNPLHAVPNVTMWTLYNPFTCSPRPSMLLQHHLHLHGWSHPDLVTYSPYSKSMQGFQSPGRGLKIALSHYSGNWLLQQLELLFKP